MATINVTIKKENGVKTRKVAIDNKAVAFDQDGKGEAQVSGTMGDASMHMVTVAITGPISAKMTTTLFCEGKALKSPEVVEVTANTEPGAATYDHFELKTVEA